LVYFLEKINQFDFLNKYKLFVEPYIVPQVVHIGIYLNSCGLVDYIFKCFIILCKYYNVIQLKESVILFIILLESIV
jgi:hypothetical protein